MDGTETREGNQQGVDDVIGSKYIALWEHN